MPSPSAIFNRVNNAILFDPLDYLELKEALIELHDLYAAHTGISAGDITDNNIMLPSGKAVSPIRAAHCLLEIQRTRIFVRGIYKAIQQLKKDFPDERIHILYAGCGPYATLVTSLTAIFSKEEIAFHLLDINPISLKAVESLYNAIQLSEYVEEYICADATAYKMPVDTTMHVVISETMLNGLRKEPQVDIMLNLIPQMHEKALFIPHDITISAQLLSHKQEMQGFLVGGNEPERLLLKNIYSIGRDNCSVHEGVAVTIPDKTINFSHLSLLTQITTFAGEQLNAYECSLNIPIFVANVQGNAGRTLSFNYRRGENPMFEHAWQS